MFKNLLRAALKMAPIAVLPLVTQKTSCFFWDRGPKLYPNKIENRSFVQVLVSNAPCEDRNDLVQLTSIDGYAAAVYDGHGGWQVSQLCSDKLLKKLDEILKINKERYNDEQQLIIQSIKQVFLEIEKQYLSIALLSYEYGFGRAARAGSCALICVVHNNRVYCGNAGDSLGLLVHQDIPMGYTQINRELNANNPEEQQRLKALFPNEQDIVVCKRQNNTSCYIKGRLQPTRSLGDFRLKYSQFNNPKNYSREMEFQPPLKTFTGHYITAIPEIKVFQLNKTHKSIILASDGLWDKLGRQEVAEAFKSTPLDKVPSLLIQKCLKKASEQTNLSVEQIKAKPQGKKRKIHDDITIVVLNLEKQLK